MKILLALILAVAHLLPGTSVWAVSSGAPQKRGVIEQGEFLVLDNGLLRLRFRRNSGMLEQVRNLVAELNLFPEQQAGSPIPRVVGTNGMRVPVRGFDYTIVQNDGDAQVIALSWRYRDSIQCTVKVELLANSQVAKFWPQLTNDGPLSLRSITYPNFPVLNTLGPSASQDVLVHPFARGLLIKDPVHSLNVRRNPLSSASYPQAYNGLTHQLLDYYTQGVGGFFFATFDIHSTEKIVKVAVEGERLGISWTYESWDDRPGAALDFDFPFVLGANTTGDWYEAADIYRDWVETTDMCQSAGRLVDRDPSQKASWLLEDIGLATFGTSAAVDQSAWFRAYHRILGAPVFHVTGHDAVQRSTSSPNPLAPRVTLHEANRRALEETGDPYAIFLADLETSFLQPHVAHAIGRGGLEIAPRVTPEACPVNKLWQYIHGQRAQALLTVTGADALYCDASAPNRNLSCSSEDHGHPPGRGRWMNEGYRELYRGTRTGLSDLCGKYTPMGVELMHEGLLSSFDYYQARNGGGFMGGLEGGYFRGKQLQGKIQTIPVFSYIFHEYAPVALDGCGKATKRVGDIFYWMASRVALAGGIFELNNEFSPTERFPGMDCVSILHYRHTDPLEWVAPGKRGNDAYDPLKGEFLREIAAARTDYGTDYLAYGRMLPPLPIHAPEIKLNYVFGGNMGWGEGRPNTTTFSDERGRFSVERVQHSAWKFEDRLGLFFVNLGEEDYELEEALDPDAYGKYGLGGLRSAQKITRGAKVPIEWQPGQPLRLRLPPRVVVLVEFQR